MNTTITSKSTVRRFPWTKTGIIALLALIAVTIIVMTALYFGTLPAPTTSAPSNPVAAQDSLSQQHRDEWLARGFSNRADCIRLLDKVAEARCMGVR